MDQPQQSLVLDSTPLPLSDPVATDQSRVATSELLDMFDTLDTVAPPSLARAASLIEDMLGTVALATETAQPQPHDVDTSREKHGHTVLIQRAIAGDMAGVEKLLAAGNDVNEVDDTGVSAVVYAAACGHRAVVEVLMAAKASVAVVSNGVAALLQWLCGEEEGMEVLETLSSVRSKVMAENREWRTFKSEFPSGQLEKTDATLPLLLWAARSGYVDAVKLLLAAGAKIDVTCCIQPEVGPNEEKNALILASECGQAQVVKVLLDSGADTRFLKRVSRDAFSVAITHFHVEVVKLFIAAGYGDKRYFYGHSLLTNAAYIGSVPMIHLFLAAGVDIQARDSKGMNALDTAVKAGKRAAVEALLAAGADVNAMDKHSHTALIHVENDSEITQMLLDAGADMYVRNTYGETPLHSLAFHSGSGGLKCLLNAGADTETTDSNGRTPLHGAATGDAVASLQVLLAAGANIEAKDNEGKTPLHHACWQRNRSSIKKLIKLGANVHVKNMQGRTPLHEFCLGVNFNAYDYGASYIRVILSAAVDVNAQDNDGRTPLYYINDVACMMKALLAAGADVTVRDKDGQTPLFRAVARSSYRWKVVRLLIRADADVNVKDKDGQTPLHIAVTKFCNQAARLLLRAGADVNARNNDGKTALSIACDNDSDDMVRVLLAARPDLSVVDNEGQTVLHIASRHYGGRSLSMILEAARARLGDEESTGRHSGCDEDAKDEDEDEDESEDEGETDFDDKDDTEDEAEDKDEAKNDHGDENKDKDEVKDEDENDASVSDDGKSHISDDEEEHGNDASFDDNGESFRRAKRTRKG